MIPISNQDSIAMVAISQLLLISMRPLNGPGKGVSERKFVLVNLHHRSYQGTINKVLYAKLLYRKINLVSEKGAFLRRVPIRIAFQHRNHRLYGNLLSFLFQERVPRDNEDDSRCGCGENNYNCTIGPQEGGGQPPTFYNGQ